MLRIETAHEFDWTGFNSVDADDRWSQFACRVVRPTSVSTLTARWCEFSRAESSNLSILETDRRPRVTLLVPLPVSAKCGDAQFSIETDTLGAETLVADTPECRALGCECDNQIHNFQLHAIASNNVDGRHERGHV